MNNFIFETKNKFSIDEYTKLINYMQEEIKKNVPQLSPRHRIFFCLYESVLYLHLTNKLKPEEIHFCFGSDSLGWWLDIIVRDISYKKRNWLNLHIMNKFHTKCDFLTQDDEETNFINKVRLSWISPSQEKQKKILLVEDNKTLRIIYKHHLSNNFDVTTANDGVEAIEVLEKNTFDLIISDIQMPNMDGLTLLNEVNIRYINHSSRPGFIFLTSEKNQELQDKASELCFDDYILKPVSRFQLIKVVRRALFIKSGTFSKICEQIITNGIDE